MSDSYRMCDHKEWAAAGLAADVELDRADYVNQYEDGFEVYAGEWFYEDEAALVIYWGTFGNYNSPGASHHTYAEKYDTLEEFKADLADWEAKPEYLDEEEDKEDEPETCETCGESLESGECPNQKLADHYTE